MRERVATLLNHLQQRHTNRQTDPHTDRDKRERGSDEGEGSNSSQPPATRKKDKEEDK